MPTQQAHPTPFKATIRMTATANEITVGDGQGAEATMNRSGLDWRTQDRIRQEFVDLWCAARRQRAPRVKANPPPRHPRHNKKAAQ